MRRTTLRGVNVKFAVITLLFALAMAFPMGVMFLFIQARGIDLLAIGTLVGINAVTVVLLELPTGGLADVWGRKRVLLLALAAGVLSTGVFIGSSSFLGFAVAMLFSGATAALFSGTGEAMFVDSLKEVDPEVNLQQSMSVILTMKALGMALGAILGGFLPRWFAHLPPEGEGLVTPLAVPFVFALIAWGLTFVAVAGLLREPSVESDSPPEPAGLKSIVGVMGRSVRLAFKDRLVLLLVATAALFGFVFASIEAFWQPHFANLQQGAETDTRAFGFIVAMSLLFTSMGTGLAGGLSRFTGKHYGYFCAGAAGALAISILVFSLQKGWIAAMIGFWIVYVFSGLLTAPFQAIFNSSIPSNKRATLISLQSLTMKIGVFLGGLGLGYLAQRFSIPLAWRFGAVAFLLALPIFAYADRLHVRRLERLEAEEEAEEEVAPAPEAAGGEEGGGIAPAVPGMARAAPEMDAHPEGIRRVGGLDDRGY